MNSTIIRTPGFVFAVSVEQDDDDEPPWNRADGHGPVTSWMPVSRKQPGWMVLAKDHSYSRFYDYQAAVAQAKREGWGCVNPATGDYTWPTKGMQAAAAAMQDFERLRGWCCGDWCYEVLTVEMYDENEWDDDDRPTRLTSYSIGGVESDCGDEYRNEMIHDCIQECLCQHERNLNRSNKLSTV